MSSDSLAGKIGDKVVTLRAFEKAFYDTSQSVKALSLRGWDTPLQDSMGASSPMKDLSLVSLLADLDLRHELEALTTYVQPVNAGCLTEFHCDFAGTVVQAYLQTGIKLWFLFPWSPGSLERLAEWQSGPRSMWFPAFLRQKVYCIKQEAGQTILLPSGWFHAIYTVEDAVTFASNYLVLEDLGKHCQIWEEDQLWAKDTDGSHFPNLIQIVVDVVTGVSGRLMELLQVCAYSSAPIKIAMPVDKASLRQTRRQTLQSSFTVDALASLEQVAVFLSRLTTDLVRKGWENDEMAPVERVKSCWEIGWRLRGLVEKAKQRLTAA